MMTEKKLLKSLKGTTIKRCYESSQRDVVFLELTDGRTMGFEPSEWLSVGLANHCDNCDDLVVRDSNGFCGLCGMP